MAYFGANETPKGPQSAPIQLALAPIGRLSGLDTKPGRVANRGQSEGEDVGQRKDGKEAGDSETETEKHPASEPAERNAAERKFKGAPTRGRGSDFKM